MLLKLPWFSIFASEIPMFTKVSTPWFPSFASQKSRQKTVFSTALPGTLGGAVVLSLELPAQSTVAELEERMVTALGGSWKNASFWLGEHQEWWLKQLQPCGR